MAETPKPEPTPSRPIDVGARQIGAVYAKAFVAAAEQAGQLESAVAELDALIGEALDPYPDFEKVLGSALLKHEEKEAIIDRVFGGRLSPFLVKFLKVVSSHGRLDAMRGIHHEVHKRYDVIRGILRVRMSTATPINGQLLAGLHDSLGRILGRRLEVEQDVDPRLIGGVVLRVGDTVYDGSVARQLMQVREQMINRSVHEIQSRRDRFRHPGGN